MTARVLDRRSLNRATLARQLLLERASPGVPEAVEHLAGLPAAILADGFTAGCWRATVTKRRATIWIAHLDRPLDVTAAAAALLAFLAPGAGHDIRDAGRGWPALLDAATYSAGHGRDPGRPERGQP